MNAHPFCIVNDRKQQFDAREKSDGQKTSIVDDEGIGWEVEFRLTDTTQQPGYSADMDEFKCLKYPSFFQDDLEIKSAVPNPLKVEAAEAPTGLGVVKDRRSKSATAKQFKQDAQAA